MKAVIFDFNRTIFDPDTKELMSGAKDVLRLLRSKGFPLFLIAKGDATRKKQIEELGIQDFFKKIIINQNKSADDFRSCINECENRTQFFAIGDRVKEEIRHANVCGMTTIWFRNGKFANEQPANDLEKPKFIVAALREVLEIIFQ